MEVTALDKWLGLIVSQVQGKNDYLLKPTEQHIGNPVIRALHGGVVATFMERVAQIELLIRQDAIGNDMSVVDPINFNVDYLLPAEYKPLNANAVISKTGRRIAIVEVIAWQADKSRPVAKATCSFSLTDRHAPISK